MAGKATLVLCVTIVTTVTAFLVPALIEKRRTELH